MEYVTLIPWTPRTIRNPPDPEPEVQSTTPKNPNPKPTLCERTLAILHPVIFKALRPFPEAREALRLALHALGNSLAAA